MLKSMNTATKITLVRIALLPIILFFYVSAEASDVAFFENWGKLIALIFFAIAAATDWLDGWVARKFNQISNTGKLLDPVADKMLMLLGFILIVTDSALNGPAGIEYFPYWFAVITVFVMLGRDIIMSSLRFIAVEQGITIAADRFGKYKTVFQIAALIGYMLFAFNLNANVQFIEIGSIWFDIFGYLCFTLLTIATLFSIYSCGNYIRNYIVSIKQKSNTKENINDGGKTENNK